MKSASRKPLPKYGECDRIYPVLFSVAETAFRMQKARFTPMKLPLGHHARVPKKKMFYGWVIVITSMIIMMIALGLVGNCNSLYIVPICDDLGITRSEGAFLNTVSSIGGMLMSAFSAKLYSKVSVRRTVQIGALVLALFYALISIVENKWLLYALYMVDAFATWSMGYIPFAIILSNWFERRTGFVIGLVYMATGIGGMVFSPIIGNLINSFGWRTTHLIMGAVIAMILIPTSFFIFDKPSDKGLLPYGHEPDLGPAPVDKSMLLGTPFSEAVRTPALWVILGTICFTNFAVTGYHGTFAAFLSDVGYPITVASLISSGNMASLAAGKIVLGFLFDRIGCRTTSILSGASAVICLISALFLPSKIALVIELVMFSLGIGYGSVASPVLLKYKFGLVDFAKISGFVMTFSQVFSALGSFFSGIVRDLTGSYGLSYVFFAIMILIMQVLLVPVLSTKKSVPAEVKQNAEA